MGRIGGVAAVVWVSVSSAASPLPAAAVEAEQKEADYRVIAARCGTPAFERAFLFQSRRLVAAGIIAPGRDVQATEKSITELRRNPIVLVAGWSDCPAQLAELSKLQKSRASLATRKTARAH